MTICESAGVGKVVRKVEGTSLELELAASVRDFAATLLFGVAKVMQEREHILNAQTIEDDLEGLFRQVFASEIADGNITLTTQSPPNKEPSGKIISIHPSRPGCAQITAFCENGGAIIYLTIGENTPLEVPVEGEDYTESKGAEEIITLVRTVAAGRFEETVWVRGSQVVRSVGRLFIDADRPIKIVDCELSKLFGVLFSRKQVHEYLPYA